MDFNEVIKTVQRVAPRAHNNYLEAIRRGEQLFNDHHITTTLRMAHFLAQRPCTRPVASGSCGRT